MLAGDVLHTSGIGLDVSKMYDLPVDVEITSYKMSGDTPKRSPIVIASAAASALIPANILLQILVACPRPPEPQCTIFFPIPCNIGLAFSKLSLSPPHMKVRVPASAPMTPPDTGASIILKPADFAAS